VRFYVAFNEIPEEVVSNSTVYFLRDTKERVAVPKDLTEANEILPQVIKSGMLTDDALLMLKNAISQVNDWQLLYMESRVFLGNKTIHSVCFLPIEHLKLEMPTVSLDREVTVLATVPGVVQSLKSCAVTWKKLISGVLGEQLKKVPQGNGPLAEINLWRENNAALSALTEQIKLPEVQKVLEILQEADSKFTGDLQTVLSDLK
ncbi:DYH10 protein, partial [Chloropsis cyanopogon]|nr:DYH10 protein [Chloropsis cyanopogon]